MGVGRVNTPELAEKILESDQVDLLGMEELSWQIRTSAGKRRQEMWKTSITVLDVIRGVMTDLRTRILHALHV